MTIRFGRQSAVPRTREEAARLFRRIYGDARWQRHVEREAAHRERLHARLAPQPTRQEAGR
jgi:hypothetical protein